MKYTTILIALLLSLVSCTPGKEAIIGEGSLESKEVIVSSEANGKILTFLAEEGYLVSKGQKLGTIDDTQLVLKREQLLATKSRVESQLPNVQVQLAPLTQQLAVATTEQKRIASLFAAKAASSKQVDDINAQVETLSLQLAAMKSTLEQSVQAVKQESVALSSQIAQLDDQIENCSITSPIDGTVLATYGEPGELASAGRALFKVADLGQVYLRGYVTASELTKLKMGQKVKVKVDYGESGNRLYPGQITWISDKAEFTPKTVQTRDERAALVYAVKVSLVNDGYLKLGMYGAIVEGN